MTTIATPVLDDFNRANATLNTGNWAAAIGVTAMSIVSNVAKSTTSSQQSSYWTTPFSPDQEVYYTISTSVADMWLMLRLTSPAIAAFTGYQLSWDGAVYKLWKVVAGAQTQIGPNSGADTLSAGDVLSFRAEGPVLTVSRNGVTKHTVQDDAAKTGGYIAMQVVNTTPAVDNFGGGNLSKYSPHAMPTVLA